MRRAADEQENPRGASDPLDFPDLVVIHGDRRMDRHPDQGIPETSRRSGRVRRDQHRRDSRLFPPRFGHDLRVRRFEKGAERTYGTIGKPVAGSPGTRKIVEKKHCSQCHSIFERERKIGPKLQSSRFYGSFLDVFSTLWNHAPAMAVYMRKEVLDRPQFSTGELNQLVSFLYMLPYLGESGNPRKGEALLEGKACFRCHSLARKGKKDGVPLDALAVYQSQVVLLQRMWNHGPEMIRRMVTAGTAIPTFSGNDMTDIFAALTESAPEKSRKVFLGVGNVENGLKVFTDKGCNQCHAIRS